MAFPKHIPGEPMQPNQLNYLAGKLSHQAKQAINAKAVRKYLIEHPGSTRADLEKAGLQSLSQSLAWLFQRKLAKRVRPEQGPDQYFHIPMDQA